jgi:hypothetical protein
MRVLVTDADLAAAIKTALARGWQTGAHHLERKLRTDHGWSFASERFARLYRDAGGQPASRRVVRKRNNGRPSVVASNTTHALLTALEVATGRSATELLLEQLIALVPTKKEKR